MDGKCRASNAAKLPAKCELRPEQWGSMDRNRDDTTHLTNSWLANYNGLSTTNPSVGDGTERDVLVLRFSGGSRHVGKQPDEALEHDPFGPGNCMCCLGGGVC